MPFRARIKQMFSHSSSGSTSSGSTDSQTHLDWRNDSTVYAPHETMPRPKYRMPPRKEHKKMLDDYSWTSNIRFLRSRDSLYSPGGTRMPSRNVSRTGSRAGSRNASRTGSRDSSRAPSRRDSLEIPRPRPKNARGRSFYGPDDIEEDKNEAERLENVTLSRRGSGPVPPSATRAARTGPRRHAHLSEIAQASVTRAANKTKDGRLAPPPTSEALAEEPAPEDESPELARHHTANDHQMMSEEEIQEALLNIPLRSERGAIAA